MSKIKKEISCVVGTYTNKDGVEKKRYQRIGSIIETRNGEMLKLDNIPLVQGGWDGWCYIQDPRPKTDLPSQTQRRQDSGFDDMDSDLPF